MAPAEAHGRAVGHFRHRFDRLGPGEQFYGTEHERRRTLDGRVILCPSVVGPHLDRGEFRNMRVVRRDAQHATKAEACAEPVDQLGELFPVVGRAGAGNACAKSGLHVIEPLRDDDREADHVETEAGIVLVAERGQALGEQAAHQCGGADRPAGGGREPQHLPVDPEQGDFEEPRPFAVLRQRALDALSEPPDGAAHVALERDRIGEALLGDVAGQGPTRRNRLVVAP